MQTATETTTAGFADLICSDPEWLEAEFAALVARTGLEPPRRAGTPGPPSATPGDSGGARFDGDLAGDLDGPDARIRAVARCPPGSSPPSAKRASGAHPHAHHDERSSHPWPCRSILSASWTGSLRASSTPAASRA
jgi:hypothetical protein